MQLHTESQGLLKLSQAISSIPAYIEKCEFFVALCPVLTHVDTAQAMDQYTWAKRGWCRVEKAVRNLLAPNDMMLMIESPKHMSMLALRDALFHPFGAGEFTIERDRHVVGRILRDILELKLHNDLWKGNLLEYRFFMNRQDMLFQNCDLPYIPAPLRISSKLDSLDDGLHEFLHQNGFLNVTDRDGWGFSPLCYAVTQGSLELVKALLAKKANPNDRILKANKKPGFAESMIICFAMNYSKRHGKTIMYWDLQLNRDNVLDMFIADNYVHKYISYIIYNTYITIYHVYTHTQSHTHIHVNFFAVKVRKFTSPKNVSVLSLCVLHKSHGVLELLLTARADPNHRDGVGSTALIYSAFSNDGAGATA